MEVSWTASDTLNLLDSIVAEAPMPLTGTEVARRCAEAIGRHLVFLVLTASDANLAGRHSAALALFRALEDALDCFAAVSLVPDAAARWAKGKLKASEAARLWEPLMGDVLLPTGERPREYRKQLRSYFNEFDHCCCVIGALNGAGAPHIKKGDQLRVKACDMKQRNDD